MQLPLVFEGQMPVRQDVFGGILEEGRGLSESRAESVGDFAQLRHRGRVIGLRENGADDRGDGLAGALGHRREQVTLAQFDGMLDGEALKLSDGRID